LIDAITTLEQRGVGFRSLREQVDTTTAAGRLVFHLFGAWARMGGQGDVRHDTRYCDDPPRSLRHARTRCLTGLLIGRRYRDDRSCSTLRRGP